MTFSTRPSTYHISLAPTGRACCRKCKKAIHKGAVRLEICVFVRPGRYTLLLRPAHLGLALPTPALHTPALLYLPQRLPTPALLTPALHTYPSSTLYLPQLYLPTPALGYPSSAYLPQLYPPQLYLPQLYLPQLYLPQLYLFQSTGVYVGSS